MNLVVDIGNTTAKAYLFDGDLLAGRTLTKDPHEEAFLIFLRTPGVRHALLAASGEVPGGIIRELEGVEGTFLKLGPETPLPFHNLYRTPHTLGYDRIAAVAGAYHLYPGEDVLVVDAGTAVTYDLLTAQGTYQGGAISPGLTMRFRALHTFTARLPFVQDEGPAPWPATTTDEAIRSGVVRGLTDEIDAAITRTKEKYPALRTLLTGGDAVFFEKRLKNSIFVIPELGAYGLNRILRYNVQD